MKNYFILFLILFALTSCSSPHKEMTIYYAPCFSPIITSVRSELEQKLDCKIITEISGSQMICRKIADLDRTCDLVMLADERLFNKLLKNHTSWHINFAHDEIVLGIGAQAKHVDQAEKNWVSVLQDPDVNLGRVNETLGPIGYRTLLLWQLKEDQNTPGLKTQLIKHTKKILDHVDHLATVLKSGEVDYGFMYQTTCRQHNIRYINLDKTINMGNSQIDYAQSSITIPSKISNRSLTINGSLITYGLSIPNNAENPELAEAFINELFLHYNDLFIDKGYNAFKPKFKGNQNEFAPYHSIADYKGQTH